MIYKICKLRFLNGVHFGSRNLDESKDAFHADTLFSALFIEAMKKDNKFAQHFLERTKEGKFLLSDAFPYIGDNYYLQKPNIRITGTEEGDSTEKKAWKKLKYIPMSKVGSFMKGEICAGEEQKLLKGLGKKELKTSVSITEGLDSEPYHVGIYYFGEGNGLYFIAGMEEDFEQEFYELMDALSFAGLGGKRSAGLGRFELEKEEILPGEHFADEESSGMKMLLGTAFPKEQELEAALQSASYQLIKRGGFVLSDSYADEPRKKLPFYVFDAGACFENYFLGDVFDVSGGGNHPVYRYAKTLFWKLDELCNMERTR